MGARRGAALNQRHPIIPIAPQAPTRQRKREAPRGRRIDPTARSQVLALLGDAPRTRDLLIEHLHKLQDRFGHLSAAHLAALAAEMGLAQTEVFEVATFYHHFDVVKEGEAAPPAITVRVCDGLSCEMAGARELLAKLPKLLGPNVRVIPAPCIGRCEQAPAAVVGQNPMPRADAATTRTSGPSSAGNRASRSPAPASSHDRLSQTRTVSGAGAASPSLTMSKW